jgi:hypothetical protein
MRKTYKHRYSLGLYKKFNTNHSQETKNKIAKSKMGQKLTEEHKNKISVCSSGRTWIHNKDLKERKFIKKEEIDFYFENGWKNGKGVIWMNNGVNCMCVDIWDYQYFIKYGYVDGRIKC